MARSTARATRERAVRRIRDPGVMAGRHEVGPDLLAVGPELAELEPDVAHDARIRRPPGHVLVGEIIHDPREVALEVEGVERDIEPVGDALGIHGIGDAAAGLRPPLRVLGVGTGAHEQADHIVPMLLQQAGGDRAINSAAHRQDNATLPCDLDIDD